MRPSARIYFSLGGPYHLHGLSRKVPEAEGAEAPRTRHLLHPAAAVGGLLYHHSPAPRLCRAAGAGRPAVAEEHRTPGVVAARTLEAAAFPRARSVARPPLPLRTLHRDPIPHRRDLLAPLATLRWQRRPRAPA